MYKRKDTAIVRKCTFVAFFQNLQLRHCYILWYDSQNWINFTAKRSENTIHSSKGTVHSAPSPPPWVSWYMHKAGYCEFCSLSCRQQPLLQSLPHESISLHNKYPVSERIRKSLLMKFLVIHIWASCSFPYTVSSFVFKQYKRFYQDSYQIKALRGKAIHLHL